MSYLDDRLRTPWNTFEREEGGRCIDIPCEGTYRIEKEDGCSCHINTPCDVCENSWLECGTCGERG